MQSSGPTTVARCHHINGSICADRGINPGEEQLKEQVIKSRDARLSDSATGILPDIAIGRISGILWLNGTGSRYLTEFKIGESTMNL